MKTLSHCDPDSPLTGSKTRLRAKAPTDAERDYLWQADPETARLDATEPLKMTFSRYCAEYMKVLSFHSPERRLFAIDTLDGKHIGNCSYYNIDWLSGEAELGVMIGDTAHRGKGYGADAVNTLLFHIFEQTDLKRIRLKTLWDNLRAQKCFRKCGFAASGEKTIEEHHFLIMEIDRKRWLKQTARNSVQTGTNAKRITRA